MNCYLVFFSGGCLRFPVGITDSFIIPDASITATDSDPNFAATKVRMSDPSAWCLLEGQSGSPYLEVDFGEDVLVCAVETRGFDDGGDELYAEEFELSFSTDGSTFTKYTEDSSSRVRTHDASTDLRLLSRIIIKVKTC